LWRGSAAGPLRQEPVPRHARGRGCARGRARGGGERREPQRARAADLLRPASVEGGSGRRRGAGEGACRGAPCPTRGDRARLRSRRAPVPVVDAAAREGAGVRRRALGRAGPGGARRARMIGRLGAGVAVGLVLAAPAAAASYSGTLTFRGLEASTITVQLSAAQAVVSLGPGHAAHDVVPVTRAGARVRFSLPC